MVQCIYTIYICSSVASCIVNSNVSLNINDDNSINYAPKQHTGMKITQNNTRNTLRRVSYTYFSCNVRVWWLQCFNWLTEWEWIGTCAHFLNHSWYRFKFFSVLQVYLWLLSQCWHFISILFCWKCRICIKCEALVKW